MYCFVNSTTSSPNKRFKTEILSAEQVTYKTAVSWTSRYYHISLFTSVFENYLNYTQTILLVYIYIQFDLSQCQSIAIVISLKWKYFYGTEYLTRKLELQFLGFVYHNFFLVKFCNSKMYNVEAS